MLKKEPKLVEPQVYKINSVFVNEKLPLQGSKAKRAEKIHTSTVTVNDMVFDANEESITRMGYYLTNAAAKYTKARSSGSTGPSAYAACYTNVMVNWKLADNAIVTISLENLSSVHDLAIQALQSNWV
jgi:hypothetical protein